MPYRQSFITFSKTFDVGTTRTIIDTEFISESPPVPCHPVSSFDDKHGLIPRYEAGIFSGHRYHNCDHVEVSQTHGYRLDWIRKHSLRPEDLYVIEASGHSMEPRISDVDVLLVNKADKEFHYREKSMFCPSRTKLSVSNGFIDWRMAGSEFPPTIWTSPSIRTNYYSAEGAAHLNNVGKVVQRGYVPARE